MKTDPFIYDETFAKMNELSDIVIYAQITSKEAFEYYVTLNLENISVIKGDNFEKTSLDITYITKFEEEKGNISKNGFPLGNIGWNNVGVVTYDNVIKDKFMVYIYLTYNNETYNIIDNSNAICLSNEDASKYASLYY